MTKQLGIHEFVALLDSEPVGTMWITSTEVVIKQAENEWCVKDNTVTVVDTSKVAMACYVRQLGFEGPHPPTNKVWSLS